MDKDTQRNLKLWIETNLDKFPKDFTYEDFENSSTSVQSDLMTKIYSSMGYRGYWENYTLKKSDFSKIGNIKISTTLQNRLKKATIKRVQDAQKALRANEPAPKWHEIETRTQNAFKSWLGGHTKKYDEKFSVKVFDDLPDEIKVEFLFTLAKKFGVQDYYDLKKFHRTAKDMKLGVKNLKISEEIQDAIYDVVPMTKGDLITSIKNSDRDGTWSAQANIAMAKGLKQEEIDDARENRKANKKLAKLKARVKAITSLQQYKITLEDELFDRSMFETILKRMENKSAFKDTWSDHESKDIIKMIVNHPLATTDDLMRIKKVKTKGWNSGSQPYYNSSHLNSAMANKGDLDKAEVMKLVKMAQYDLKVKVASRDDLEDADKNIIREYSIKHHAHMPDQLKEIFEKLDEEVDDYSTEIIVQLKKKYSKSGWTGKPNGMKFLDVIDTYNYFDKLTEKDKEEMVEIIAKAYEDNRVSKERIMKMITKISDQATEFWANLYERTGEEDFLPKTVQDMFLF